MRQRPWRRRGVALAALISSVALAPARGARADEQSRRQAQHAFTAAKRLFVAGEYRAAITAFERAYRLQPHFQVQCSIARCHDRLDEPAAAAERYQRCLDEGGERAPIAAQVREALAQARAKVPSPLPAPAAAPEPAPAPARQPSPPPGREGLPRHWFWIAAGVTVVLAAATTIVGVKTLGCKSDYDQRPTEAGYEACRNLRLASNILAGATAAAAGAGVMLYFYTDFNGGKGDGRRDLSGVGLLWRVTF